MNTVLFLLFNLPHFKSDADSAKYLAPFFFAIIGVNKYFKYSNASYIVIEEVLEHNVYNEAPTHTVHSSLPPYDTDGPV